MTLDDLKRASRWINEAENEDDVVAKALSLLPSRDRWCAEVTGHLKLYSDYPLKRQTTSIKKKVGWSQIDDLDLILGRSPIPKDFDFLSIAVHGNDYYIWDAMQTFRPKMVTIEFNATADNRIDYVQPHHAKQGSSPAALVRLGKQQGYELICVIKDRLLFVDVQFYSLFNIPDNSLPVMRDDDCALDIDPEGNPVFKTKNGYKKADTLILRVKHRFIRFLESV
jgi:hypothetical protein